MGRWVRVGMACAAVMVLFAPYASAASPSPRGPVTHITTEDLVVALTLDDGYAPDDRIVEYLAAQDIDGTAFIVGQVAEADPAFVRSIDAMGWMVCSHTYEHRILTALSRREIVQEITRGADAIEEIVGYRCPYFRAPGGAVNEDVMAAATLLGLTVIGWNASLSDSTEGVSEADQLRVVGQDLRPGSVLLGHWGGVHSFSVLTQVIDGLRRDGYRIVSVDELLHGPSPTPTPTLAPAVALQASGQAQALPDGAAEWRRLGLAAAPGLMILTMAGVFAVLTRRSRRRHAAD